MNIRLLVLRWGRKITGKHTIKAQANETTTPSVLEVLLLTMEIGYLPNDFDDLFECREILEYADVSLCILTTIQQKSDWTSGDMQLNTMLNATVLARN